MNRSIPPIDSDPAAPAPDFRTLFQSAPALYVVLAEFGAGRGDPGPATFRFTMADALAEVGP